jgi:hypothetical protein
LESIEAQVSFIVEGDQLTVECGINLHRFQQVPHHERVSLCEVFPIPRQKPGAHAVADRLSPIAIELQFVDPDITFRHSRHWPAFHGRRERDADFAVAWHRPKLNRSRPISADHFKNGQRTPCLRTARTYAILTTNP